MQIKIGTFIFISNFQKVWEALPLNEKIKKKLWPYCNFVYFVRNILCSDSSSNSQVEKLNPMHFLIARQLDQLSLNEGMSLR